MEVFSFRVAQLTVHSGIKATLEQGLSPLLGLKPGTCLLLWVSQRHMYPCTCTDTRAHNTLHTQPHVHMHTVPRTQMHRHVCTHVGVRGNLSKSSREWGSGVSTKGAGRARCESACSGASREGAPQRFPPKDEIARHLGPDRSSQPLQRWRNASSREMQRRPLGSAGAREVGGAHRICSAEI